MRDLSLPTRVEEALLGETEGWSAAVLAALRVWSAIHLPFDEHLAMQLLEHMHIPFSSELLNKALIKRVLHIASSEPAFLYPYWTSLEQSPTLERFEFRREAMRIALARSLTVPQRQALRSSLAELLQRPWTVELLRASQWAARAGRTPARAPPGSSGCGPSPVWWPTPRASTQTHSPRVCTTTQPPKLEIKTRSWVHLLTRGGMAVDTPKRALRPRRYTSPVVQPSRIY